MPYHFQEQIDGPSDIRATIIGQHIFAARIDKSEDTPARIPG